MPNDYTFTLFSDGLTPVDYTLPAPLPAFDRLPALDAADTAADTADARAEVARELGGAPLIPATCPTCGSMTGPATWSDLPRGSWYCYSRECKNHAGVKP